MTVKELMAVCKEVIKQGHGDKEIWLSNDDEGNGYHQMFFNFTYDVEGNDFYGQFKKGDNDKKILLG